MAKIFVVVFLIFGTVVGSGFSSGKEIMVFFSRFGELSYLFIVLACVLFFGLFSFFLLCGKKLLYVLQKYKFLNLVNAFICIVFCASMFAGIKNLFSYFPAWGYFIAVTILILCTIFVTLRGIKGLEKVNFLLMPITSVLFLFVLFFAVTKTATVPLNTSNELAGILYSPLYVALNTCMSGIVICKAGDSLTKKQCLFASAFASCMIGVFLILGNFVLQKNGTSIISEMPFLTISAENKFMFNLSYLVILIGCFTTLISECFTLKTSIEPLTKNNKLSTLLAVFVPFAISSLGFSCIVSFLYPICSVLGIFVLVLMILSQVAKT